MVAQISRSGAEYEAVILNVNDGSRKLIKLYVNGITNKMVIDSEEKIVGPSKVWGDKNP